MSNAVKKSIVRQEASKVTAMPFARGAGKMSLYIFYGLLAYMPLHIFLSIWFGTSFNVLEFAKIFKDILLIIGFVLVLVAALSKEWLVSLKHDKLAWLVGLYALLTVFMAVLKPTDLDAEVLGVLYNLRFLVFFIYGMLLTRLYKPDWLQKNALRVVLGVSLVVMVFGFVQYMWLPNDALTHVGYTRSNGVLPVFLIDDKPDLERIMSTVRDPNSFGSYLVIIVSLALTYLLVTKNRDLKKIYSGLLALATICLLYTFSRSAWIGAVLAVAVVIGLIVKNSRKIKFKKEYLVALAVLLAMLGTITYMARDSYFVKNVILHADENTVLEDPNELRIRFWKESVQAGTEKPLGYGPGTAGLASVRNDIQGTILNENYYFQIMHEVGVVGLILFLGIISLIAKRLYFLSVKNPLALALLASFVGLLVTNFLVHIWSNEAVAYTWWGLAGLVLYRNRIKGSNSHNKG